jgi:hypothetical protein
MEEKNKSLLLKFLGSLDTEVNRPRGFLVLDNLVDPQEMIVLTLWETKEQMTQFYSPTNPALSAFVKNTQEFMEQPPQRSDYEVVEYKMQSTAESPRQP